MIEHCRRIPFITIENRSIMKYLKYKFESPEENDVTSTLKEVNKKLWLLLIRWDVSAHVVYM
jgi:hypothetical protein